MFAIIAVEQKNNADKGFFCLIWIFIQNAAFSSFDVYTLEDFKILKLFSILIFKMKRWSSHKAKHFSAFWKFKTLQRKQFPFNVRSFFPTYFSRSYSFEKSLFKHKKKLKTSLFARVLAQKVIEFKQKR